MYAQPVRCHPLEGVEHPVQHVIGAVKRTRAFDREHVGWALYDTDGRLVAALVSADGTEPSSFSDIAASLTERQFGLHVLERMGEAGHVLARLAHQPERDPLGRFGSNAGKPTQFVHDGLQGWWVVQWISSAPGNISVIKWSAAEETMTALSSGE